MDKKYLEFLDKLDDLKNGKNFPFTLILDDPSDNCFVYNPNAPLEDPKIVIEYYERSEEQNDDLGITHMNVE